MAGRSETSVLSFMDRAPLSGRYWLAITLFSLQFIFEYFDFFVVGFLVAVIAPQWHLTYGQSSIILLSAGVGSIIGAVVFGKFADGWGRKQIVVISTVIYSLSAGAIALVPDGAWILFSSLRFLVGFGLAGATTAQTALIVEFTPTRFRTVISSAMYAPVSLGILLASVSAATLLHTIGWRGLAALGATPLVIGIAIAFLVPESIPWLIARNQIARARANLAWLFKMPPETIAVPATPPAPEPKVRFSELYRERTRFWFTVVVWLGITTAVYGVLLWGPTILALLLGIPTQAAAKYFIYYSLAGLFGRIPFLFLVQHYGRRPCGLVMGYAAALCLAGAALFHSAFLGSIPVFMLFLVIGNIFVESEITNIAPYTAEMFPVRLAGRGVGLSQLVNGIGKIIGPLCLAVIAGTTNFVTPQATEAAVLPAFLFLAACALATGLAFTFVRIETHRRPLALAGSGEPAMVPADEGAALPPRI